MEDSPCWSQRPLSHSTPIKAHPSRTHCLCYLSSRVDQLQSHCVRFKGQFFLRTHMQFQPRVYVYSCSHFVSTCTTLLSFSLSLSHAHTHTQDKTCIIWDSNNYTFIRQLGDHFSYVSLVTINQLNVSYLTLFPIFNSPILPFSFHPISILPFSIPG